MSKNSYLLLINDDSDDETCSYTEMEAQSLETDTQSLEKEEMESQNIEDDYNEDDEIGATPIQQINSTNLEDKSTYIPNHVQRENDMINLDEYDNMDVQEIQF